jgi:hypothetical protein
MGLPLWELLWTLKRHLTLPSLITCKAAEEYGVGTGCAKMDLCHAWRLANCDGLNGLQVKDVC